MATAKSNIKCPECGSDELWKIGYIPTRTGKKHRMKCTKCARTFYLEDAMKRTRKKK